ncbi:hypothetical protein GCM10023205_41810 [Yinghuangia aomiensis]|uniref:DUF397 domain-containing protein n=1 Tax=Yinghuangia aomiensis TaxID=676205 RepID=A0ABP9HIG8_9ACTN
MSRPRPESLAWRKSSYSNQAGGDCVEVADGCPGVVPVRDSKEPARGFLSVSTSSWATMTAALKSAARA